VRVAIAGASGLIGTALRRRLAGDGHEVIRLERGPGGGYTNLGAAAGVDALVNLAGAGIGAHRWTAEYKATLRASRLEATRLLAGLDVPLLVNASAVGYYGDRGDELLDETSAPGDDFLAVLCRDWEAAASSAGGRVVLLRSGMVLSGEGGALRKQLPLFKLGLGGHFGDGRQWVSWISLDDEVAAIVHLLTAGVAGPVNLTSPNPVRNGELTKALGKALHRPAILPIPAFAPRLVLGGELVDALLLASQRVVPTRLLESGFTFAHPTLAGALDAQLGT